MGLLYIFPIAENETDHVEVLTDPDGTKTLRLKSYGLPLIFWGYLGMILLVLLIMFLTIHPSLQALWAYNDSLGHLLVVLTYGTLALTPLILLSLFFYEKILQKNAQTLTLIHKVFYVPIAKKTISLAGGQSPQFSIDHFLSSPNLARMQGREDLLAHQNRGYHELYAISDSGKKILIDRNSRMSDLKKTVSMLEKY